jgi:hypothetical protein
MRTRYSGLVLTFTAAVVLAGLAAVAAPVASAASAQVPAHRPAWRIVKIFNKCGIGDSMQSVVALSAHNAWALGAPNWANLPCGADVQHWNGSTWHRVPVPRNTDMSDFGNQPLTALSAKNVWIFPALWRSGLSLSQYNYALHWNGSRWRRSRFPVDLIVNSAAAAGWSQVWAFGEFYGKHNNVIPYAARYDGRSWHRARLRVDAVATLGPAPGGVWAFGPTLKTASRPVNKQVLLLLRWSGHAWRTLRVPRITAPKGDDRLGLAYLAAAGPSNVWVAYQAADSRSNAPVVVLHRDHRRWHRVTLPKAVTYLGGMSVDGRGGIWLLDGGVLNQVWFHYHAHAWTSQPVPWPKGYNSSIFDMTWIPGTTSALAVGEADSNTQTRTVGVAYRYTR